MNAERTFAVAAPWGAGLTIVILAMSVLLRLGTRIDAGEAVSILPSGLEVGARIAHRVAAMSVGILAAAVLVAAALARPATRSRLVVATSVAALTLVLALIGRYTPGYRIDAVTVVNVTGGLALVAAFWWLRATPASAGRAVHALAVAALLVLLALSATGAAGAAAAMRGAHAFGAPHLGLAAIFALLACVIVWRARRRAAFAVLALALLQLVLGLAMLSVPDAGSLVLGWAHAMLACALALPLVSLARPTA
ncbi:MAG: hypothetical protein ABIQ72_07210 [Usitatibacter sp.]